MKKENDGRCRKRGSGLMGLPPYAFSPMREKTEKVPGRKNGIRNPPNHINKNGHGDPPDHTMEIFASRRIPGRGSLNLKAERDINQSFPLYEPPAPFEM